MKEISSFEELENDIRESRMLLAYFSAPDCGVCGALKPKVIEILEEYPDIESRYINVREQQEAAAQHTIFTIPGILVFAEGRESIREARFVHIDDLRHRIDRLHSMVFS
jgi:thiol-disulfide isomerase/thioredoxin